MMDDLRNENCFDQQRKGFKIAYLMSKNDDFARPARFTRFARASYDYHISFSFSAKQQQQQQQQYRMTK